MQQADAAGLTRARLRSSDLRAPTRGVRAAGPAPAADRLLERCREVLPVLPAGAVFCHVTALALLGVDAPFGTDPHGALHVQVPPGVPWPRRAGVVGHSRPQEDVPSLRLPHGVVVLAPELAWVQLAARLPVGELVVAGDALLRRRSAVSTLDRLRGTVARLPPGTRGVRRLRTAVEQVRPRTDSAMETRLRRVLVEGGLPEPEVNVLVRAPGGGVVAMPDLAYPELRVAVEYDGDVHRTDARTWRRDVARRQGLEALGWRTVTCTADDVLRDPDRAIAWVRRALRDQAASPRLQ